MRKAFGFENRDTLYNFQSNGISSSSPDLSLNSKNAEVGFYQISKKAPSSVNLRKKPCDGNLKDIVDNSTTDSLLNSIGVLHRKPSPLLPNTPKLVHLSVEENSSRALCHVIKLENYSWFLDPFAIIEGANMPSDEDKVERGVLGKGWITEARNLYFISEKGELVFMQFLYTDSGWPIPANCSVTCRYFDPRKLINELIKEINDVEIPLYTSSDGILRPLWKSLPVRTRKKPKSRKPSIICNLIGGAEPLNSFSANAEREESYCRLDSLGHIYEYSMSSGSKIKTSQDKTSIQSMKSLITLNMGNASDQSDKSKHKLPPTPSGYHYPPSEPSQIDDEFLNKAHLRIYHHGTSTMSMDMFVSPGDARRPVITFADGNITFGMDQSDGAVNMRIIPYSRVTGVIYPITREIKGNSAVKERNNDVNESDNRDEIIFHGHGLCIHQYHGIRPNLVANRWNLAFFISDSDETGEHVSLFMIQMKTPSSYGASTVNLGSFYCGDSLVALCKDGIITGYEPVLDPVSGYYIPREMLYSWEGVTFDERPFKAICKVRPEILVTRVDILAQLPFVVRKIVGTFLNKPFVYQWLDRTEVRVTVAGRIETVKGWIFQELSLIDEN